MQNKENGYTGEDLLRMIANKLYEFPNIAYLADYVERKLITTVPATDTGDGVGGLLTNPPRIVNDKPSFFGSDGIWHDAIESSITQKEIYDDPNDTYYFLGSNNHRDNDNMYDAYLRANFNYKIGYGIRNMLNDMAYSSVVYDDYAHILNFGTSDTYGDTPDRFAEFNVGDGVNINYCRKLNDNIIGSIVLGNRSANASSAYKPYIFSVEDNDLTIGSVYKDYNQFIRSEYSINEDPNKCLTWIIDSKNDVKANTGVAVYKRDMKTYDPEDTVVDLGNNQPLPYYSESRKKKTIVSSGGIKFASFNYPTYERGNLYNEFTISTPKYGDDTDDIEQEIDTHIWDITSTTNMRFGIFNLDVLPGLEFDLDRYRSKHLVNQMVLIGSTLHTAGNMRAHGNAISIMPIDTDSDAPTIDNWPASNTAVNNFSALRTINTIYGNSTTDIDWRTESKISFYGPYSTDSTIADIGTYEDELGNIVPHQINATAIGNTRSKTRYVNMWSHNLYYNSLTDTFRRPTASQNVKQIFAIDAYSGYADAGGNAYPPRRVATFTVTDGGTITASADNRATEIELNGATTITGNAIIRGNAEARQNLTVGTGASGTGTVYATNIGSTATGKQVTNAFITNLGSATKRVTNAFITNLGGSTDGAETSKAYIKDIYGGYKSTAQAPIAPMGASPINMTKIPEGNGIRMDCGPIFTIRKSTDGYVPYALPEDGASASSIFYRPIIVAEASATVGGRTKRTIIEGDAGIAAGTILMFY